MYVHMGYMHMGTYVNAPVFCKIFRLYGGFAIISFTFLTITKQPLLWHLFVGTASAVVVTVFVFVVIVVVVVLLVNAINAG